MDLDSELFSIQRCDLVVRTWRKHFETTAQHPALNVCGHFVNYQELFTAIRIWRHKWDKAYGECNLCFGQLVYFCSPFALTTFWSNFTIVNTLNLLTELCFIKRKGSFIHKSSHSNKIHSLVFFFWWGVLLNAQVFPECYGHCFSNPQDIIALPLFQVVDFKLTIPTVSQWNLLFKTLPWNTGKIFNWLTLYLLKLSNNNKISSHYPLKNMAPALHHRSSKCS